MKTIFWTYRTFLIGTLAISATFHAHSQSGASALSAISAMPVASVIVASAAGAAVAIPVAFSTAGAVLIVKSVEASAKGTVYVLDRVSDGARASIEVSKKAAGAASEAVGTLILTSVISTGVVLSVAGRVIAFIPNEIGKALLHNERVSP
jgi:hypothetical protein